jgi:hypothetical protein
MNPILLYFAREREREREDVKAVRKKSNVVVKALENENK